MDWKVSAYNKEKGRLKEVTIQAEKYYAACAKYAKLMGLSSNWRTTTSFSAHDVHPGQVGRHKPW